MKELRAICEAYRNLDFSKQRAALATVVRVRGSSYRSPGARMLITDDGKWVGSISGGCLEGDALRKARQVMREKKPLAVTYDTSDEDNQSFAINLGCNGIIDVLIEPVDPHDEQNPILLYERLLGLDEAAALATCFSGNSALVGKKMLLKEGRIAQENISNPTLRALLEADLTALLSSNNSRTVSFELEGQVYEVFLELVDPAIRLMIFGGGYDARPLSQGANKLGWSVTVTDECVAHIAPVFFPDADQLSLCQREYVDKEFSITANTACVLMSHNYEYDREVLKKLLQSPASYIGLLGPRKRFDRMLRELAEGGIRLTDWDWERIHAPIGLDIGAETPDEIAIAIMAEIMGKFSRREAGYLKFRNKPIHQHDAEIPTEPCLSSG